MLYRPKVKYKDADDDNKDNDYDTEDDNYDDSEDDDDNDSLITMMTKLAGGDNDDDNCESSDVFDLGQMTTTLDADDN